MRPVETIPGMEGGWIKETDGVNSILIYCKNINKCHNIPQYNNNKNKL
jgi:hypothetical protein